MDDDYFVVRCDHCDSLHRLVTPDTPPAFVAPAKITPREARFSIDRYLKKNNLPLSGSAQQFKQLYYPYWKIDAVLFKVRKNTEKRTIVSEYDNAQEVSYETDRTEISLSPYSSTLAAGVTFDGIPDSIGLRGSYLTVTTYSVDTVDNDYDALPVMRTWEDVRDKLSVNVSQIGMIDRNSFGANKTELFCPKASLIYFPYLICDDYTGTDFNRYVVDAVSGRVVNHITSLDDVELTAPGEEPNITFGGLTVSPHRCSNCGIDLPEQQSLVYFCKNCSHLEIVEKMLFEISSVSFCPSNNMSDDIRFLPFWAFHLDEPTAQRLRPVIGGLYASDRLVIPAFRIANVDAMFRLTKRVSAAYPQLLIHELKESNSQFVPVNVTAAEALMYSSLFIYKDSYVKGLNADKLNAPFTPTRATLFYMPFARENYFFVDTILQAISVENTVIPQ